MSHYDTKKLDHFTICNIILFNPFSILKIFHLSWHLQLAFLFCPNFLSMHSFKILCPFYVNLKYLFWQFHPLLTLFVFLYDFVFFFLSTEYIFLFPILTFSHFPLQSFWECSLKLVRLLQSLNYDHLICTTEFPLWTLNKPLHLGSIRLNWICFENRVLTNS